jgi:hypothetical protein
MAKCKKCKCDFEQTEFNVPYCRSTTECIDAGNKYKNEKREKGWRKRSIIVKKPKVKKPKQKKLQTLLSDFEKVFNAFIRKRDNGNVCISCSKPNELQAGHYFAVSGYKALRFDEFNVHGECAGCNCYNESHLITYGINLPSKIGSIEYQKLIRRAEQYKSGTLENDYYSNGKWLREGIEKGIETYKNKL